jgi:hypothetical protein
LRSPVTLLCVAAAPWFSTIACAGSARDYLNAPIDSWLTTYNASFSASVIVAAIRFIRSASARTPMQNGGSERLPSSLPACISPLRLRCSPKSTRYNPESMSLPGTSRHLVRCSDISEVGGRPEAPKLRSKRRCSHPSVGRDDADIELIWSFGKPEYFCKQGWTGKPLICPSGQIGKRI